MRSMMGEAFLSKSFIHLLSHSAKTREALQTPALAHGNHFLTGARFSSIRLIHVLAMN